MIVKKFFLLVDSLPVYPMHTSAFYLRDPRAVQCFTVSAHLQYHFPTRRTAWAVQFGNIGSEHALLRVPYYRIHSPVETGWITSTTCVWLVGMCYDDITSVKLFPEFRRWMTPSDAMSNCFCMKLIIYLHEIFSEFQFHEQKLSDKTKKETKN